MHRHLIFLVLLLPACQSATTPAPQASRETSVTTTSPAPLPPDLPAVSPDDPRLQRPRVFVIGKTAADEVSRLAAAQLKRIVKKPAKGRIAEVFKTLEKETGLNFFINWPALEAAGVEMDFSIVADLPEAQADVLLKLVLNQAAGEASLESLGFDIIDGIVHISTKRDLNYHTVTRLYVLPATALVGTLDLPMPITDRDGAPKIEPGSPLHDLIERQRKADAEKKGEKETEKPKPSTTIIGRAATELEAQIEAITTLIQDTIGSQSDWAAYRGYVSSIRELHGILVVKTTRPNHADVERLLSNYLHPFPGAIETLRSREVVHLVQQADELRLAGRHREALPFAQAAVFVSPEDARAIAMHRVLLETLGLPVPPVAPPPPVTAPLNPTSSNIVGDMPAAPVRIDPAFAKAFAPISVAFEGNKLIDVLDHFSQSFGVPITANWAALEAAGVEKDAAITLRLRDVPGTAALEHVRQLAAGAALLEPIAFVRTTLGEGESAKPVIMFSTLRDLNKIADTRNYPAEDIIDWGNDGYSRYGIVNGIICFADTVTVRTPEGGSVEMIVLTREESVEVLSTLVQDSVGKQSDWQAYGGDVASIREKRGSFIMTAPVTMHLEAEELFTQLRQARIVATMSHLQHREIVGLLARAEEYRLSQRYAEALKLTEQALSVDPRHEYAVAMKRVIEETMARRSAK